jgi:hypothetical protein
MFDSHRRTIRHILDSEIARAERFHFAVGVLVLEVADDVPRGVHPLVPGETLDVEHLQRYVRRYDVVKRTDVRRYTILLPQTLAGDGPRAVRARLLRIAEERGWGHIAIGVACHPQDGATSAELMRVAATNAQTESQGHNVRDDGDSSSPTAASAA